MAHTVAIINGKQPSGGLGGVSDADFSLLLVNMFLAGVLGVNDYKVEQQASPNMTVKVNTGKAFVAKSDGSMVYQSYLDATVNGTITNNSSGNPRIDAVVIKLDLGAVVNNYANNVATIVVVAGTPAASPSAPNDSAIQTAVGAGNPFYRLAEVYVANGAASISNANITDKRTISKMKVLDALADINGKDILKFLATASAVNYLTVKNNTTGNAPEIGVDGTDSNIDLYLGGKGTGIIKAHASYGQLKAATDGATVTLDWVQSNKWSLSAGGSRTLAFSNAKVGQILSFRYTPSGSYTLTWPSGITWMTGDGNAPVQPASTKTLWVDFICTGAGAYDGFVGGFNG